MKLLRSLLVATSAFVLAQAADAQQIVSAFYGNRGRGTDVTGIVQNYVNSGQNRIYVSNKALGGDPLPGVPKSLRVTYRTGRGEFTATAGENSWLRLGGGGGAPAPEYRERDRRPDAGAVIGGIVEGIIEGEQVGRTEVKFRNNSGQSLSVYGLDRFGNWRWVTSLQPGARYSTPASRGQYFVVTDESNRTLKRVRAGGGSQWVSIP